MYTKKQLKKEFFKYIITVLPFAHFVVIDSCYVFVLHFCTSVGDFEILVFCRFSLNNHHNFDQVIQIPVHRQQQNLFFRIDFDGVVVVVDAVVVGAVMVGVVVVVDDDGVADDDQSFQIRDVDHCCVGRSLLLRNFVVVGDMLVEEVVLAFVVVVVVVGTHRIVRVGQVAAMDEPQNIVTVAVVHGWQPEEIGEITVPHTLSLFDFLDDLMLVLSSFDRSTFACYYLSGPQFCLQCLERRHFFWTLQ